MQLKPSARLRLQHCAAPPKNDEGELVVMAPEAFTCAKTAGLPEERLAGSG